MIQSTEPMLVYYHCTYFINSSEDENYKLTMGRFEIRKLRDVTKYPLNISLHWLTYSANGIPILKCLDISTYYLHLGVMETKISFHVKLIIEGIQQANLNLH